jgi:predicted transcriptional regulator
MDVAIAHNDNINTVTAKLREKEHSLEELNETIARLQEQQKQLQDDISN